MFRNLLERITRGLSRDRHLSLAERLRKGGRLLAETAAARIHLRGCDAIGAGARVAGKPHVVNDGRIEIGEDLVLTSTFSASELRARSGGELRIGHGVWINFGASISAAKRVTIGDRSQVGQYSVVADSELPGGEDARPVEIGSDVWLAGRVTVLPGAVIGDGAVITAGSIVSGKIPPRVVAGGIPARVLRSLDGAPQEPASPAELARPPETPRPDPAHRAVLISDFTVSELVQQLDRGEGPRVAAREAGFGQVIQALLAPRATDCDVAVIWTRPEAVIEPFQRLLGFEAVAPAELLAAVDEFCDLVLRAADSYRAVFVPTWTLPAYRRGLGVADARPGGASRALQAMNLRLMERLEVAPNLHVLNAQRWLEGAGRGYHEKLWYLGKVPFHEGVFAEAARDIKAALRGVAGQARKLLVLDLDDTLWGGIVGEVGWEALRLGGHDAEGEAFVAFQRGLKDLTRRGVVLALASKNEESVALQAIRAHPEMVLREDDFVSWRIDWRDKAQNIADIAAELNLGLSAVVFIDDNPVERARVREALPDVLVPEWPSDKTLYPSALLGLDCFDTPRITEEDAQRTRLYAAERRRNDLQRQVGSLDEWLASLEMRVRAEPLGTGNLARVAQLLNKTNQMNLSTRRLTEAELQRWIEVTGRSMWAVHVADRFGDAGLTGIVSLEMEDGLGRIVDFVLSCRVMGRRVEETMVHLAVEAARSQGAAGVEARYRPTPKNKPCLAFWEASGFQREGERFVWDAGRAYAAPAAIRLEVLS